MRKILIFFGVLSCISAQAQNLMTPDELNASRGIDFDTADIRVESISSDLHVLFGIGGNVLASIGSQGVLIVDDQFAPMVPKIRSSISALGGGEADFVINTHWHFDHTGGNPLMGAVGSWMVSHINSRKMLTETQIVNLVTAQVEQSPYMDDALPVITYEDQMQFFFNGEAIDLMNFGPAHTTGDTAVIFRGSNVVHMGDVFNRSGYPFIDADNGGGIDGVILFCESVLQEIDIDTIVVPGHGPIGTYEDLSNYVEMLREIRERVAVLIAEGATLEMVISAQPTAEWDEVMGDPQRLLDRAYASLKQ
tara:strand:- start:4662 stop:5582 length:921 start_codon:yes stop_codon:yes gene_type:complete